MEEGNSQLNLHPHSKKRSATSKHVFNQPHDAILSTNTFKSQKIEPRVQTKNSIQNSLLTPTTESSETKGRGQRKLREGGIAWGQKTLSPPYTQQLHVF